MGSGASAFSQRSLDILIMNKIFFSEKDFESLLIVFKKAKDPKGLFINLTHKDLLKRLEKAQVFIPKEMYYPFP